jgi:hypothetical protein
MPSSSFFASATEASVIAFGSLPWAISATPITSLGELTIDTPQPAMAATTLGSKASRQRRLQRRVEVLARRQQPVVELAEHSDRPEAIWLGALHHDEVVVGLRRKELRFEHLLAVEGVVVHIDAAGRRPRSPRE